MIQKFAKNSDDKILDYGAGKLRNSNYLIKTFNDISIFDTPKQMDTWDSKTTSHFKHIFKIEQHLNNKFDHILCSYVLNVIEDKSERLYILNQISNVIKDNGYIYLEVRNSSFLHNAITKEAFKDGFVLGKYSTKTFQKPFSKAELLELVSNFSNLNIVHTQTTSGSIIFVLKNIMQKKEE